MYSPHYVKIMNWLGRQRAALSDGVRACLRTLVVPAGRHGAAMVGSRVAGLRAKWPRLAAAVTVATLVLAAGLAWHATRTNRRPIAVPATYADSPAWEPARPERPGYLPPTPEKDVTAAIVSPVAMPAPTVEYGPPPAEPQVPSVSAGPELFDPAPNPPDGNPATVLPPLPRPAAGNVAVAGPVAAATQSGLVAPPPARSAAMEMIARQADEKTREGTDLAERGAYFAARADFVAALRVLAQGLDNDEGARRHSQALGAALTAMKEAQDFVPSPGKVEGELELAPIIAAHRTPVLKNVPVERLQALRAMKQYFTFAQEQLCLASGREFAGSMALRSLGKLYATMAQRAVPEVVLPEAQAITFLQAAILVCPRNYMAANDLGVLLAHKDDCAAALAPLEHSVRVCPCAENLSNLSAVYRRLGNVRLADLAARDAESAKAAELARQRNNNRFAGGTVQWVDPGAMAQPAGQWTDLPVRPAAAYSPSGSASAGPGPAAGPATGPSSMPIIR